MTTFEEKREDAKKHLAEAIDALFICTNPQTYGISDFKDSYVDELLLVLSELIRLKRKI